MSDELKRESERIARLAEMAASGRFADEMALRSQCGAMTAHIAKLQAALDEAQKVRTLGDYHEDYGPVVWWTKPCNEPAWIGTPLDDTWPGYHTHWTKHPAVPDELQIDNVVEDELAAMRGEVK
ncbi:hypothetical protein JN531_003990 [Flagellatimonas centrodinii]|uniref:hypothetical protein n=1 Tax=Flagellatimonas centrodinii TaxID=2806210 RepID=UPI001FEE36D5|nr:hypothetical protein [Flagellatimonas centrodinii]ULQ47448.1 hypothetical protein JN531_003990 [Flagellatimonas centrodinii]